MNVLSYGQWLPITSYTHSLVILTLPFGLQIILRLSPLILQDNTGPRNKNPELIKFLISQFFYRGLVFIITGFLKT